MIDIDYRRGVIHKSYKTIFQTNRHWITFTYNSNARKKKKEDFNESHIPVKYDLPLIFKDSICMNCFFLQNILCQASIRVVQILRL